MPSDQVINVVFAGIGGQGVLTASDLLAETALREGHDVKKSEIKGMSQRGGSVTSDVRFGQQVFSPMVPAGEADFLVVLDPTQVEPHAGWLRPGGDLITPSQVEGHRLPSRKSLNVALLGVLSSRLALAESTWLAVLQSGFAESAFLVNRAAFLAGRAAHSVRVHGHER